MVGREHVRYGFAGLLFLIAVVAFREGASNILGLTSVILGIGSLILGKREQDALQRKEEALNQLLEEKEDLREGLEIARQRKEEIQSEKQRKNQRLKNLKTVLSREGIDTQYLVDKFDKTLKAPLLVLTHISDPKYNSEKDATRIRENLRDLDTKTLHGATRIIPPRNFDQDIETKEELQKWFDEEVLDGEPSLTHRLEALAVVDLHKVFDRDTTDIQEDTLQMNTVSDLFDRDTVIPTDKLLDILARSDRISLDDELQENVALLVVPHASEEQIQAIIKSQPEIQSELGKVPQIANTDESEIRDTLESNNIPGASELAEAIKEEAVRLNDLLN